MSVANMKIYVITHTENDYYGDQERYLGASLSPEGAKDKLLAVLNCTWEQLGVVKTVGTPGITIYYVGQKYHVNYQTREKNLLDNYWHEYTITETEIQ